MTPVVAWHKRVTVTATGCEFGPHSMKIFSFHFFALVSSQNATLSSGPQHAIQNTAEIGERIVLILGSLHTKLHAG